MKNKFFKFRKFSSRLVVSRWYQSESFNSKKTFLTDQYSSFTFQKINYLSNELSNQLLKSLKSKSLEGEKIGVYCFNNYTYLISLLAVWKARGTPMCLSKLYPINFLDYFLTDSKCRLVINGVNSNDSSTFYNDLDKLTQTKKIVNFILKENEFFSKNDFKSNYDYIDLNDYKTSNDDAMLMYTSGTSGLPKGVVHTFKSLNSSIETMVNTWQWSHTDSALSTLPLNHFSGLVYCLLTPFYVKAKVDLLPKFNAELVWSKLLSSESDINLFIGVPTVFNQLMDTYHKKLTNKYSKDLVRKVLNIKMRLIGSGSAPLNVKTYNEWYDLTNYKLLERYGMTEIGMALSNPYIETNDFKKSAGVVGRPCCNCLVRIENANGQVLVESDELNDKFHVDKDKTELFGELQIKGPIVFKEYYKKKEQTEVSFTSDGWFKTGDTAEYLKDLKVYKIVGRTTVDIIKSGGYKISALDVERVILGYPLIEDCAVLGIKDSKWGQRVFSLVQIHKTKLGEYKEEEFIKWCKTNLPKYSVPSLIELTDKIPRNQLGKVNKKELIQVYERKYSNL